MQKYQDYQGASVFCSTFWAKKGICCKNALFRECECKRTFNKIPFLQQMEGKNGKMLQKTVIK